MLLFVTSLRFVREENHCIFDLVLFLTTFKGEKNIKVTESTTKAYIKKKTLLNTSSNLSEEDIRDFP